MMSRILKSIFLKHCLLILLFALFLPCRGSANETVAQAKIEEGRAFLAQHDLPSATEAFRQAVEAAEPTDASYELANLFYGVTRVLNVVYSPEANELLDRTGISSEGRNLYDWEATLPEDADGDVIMPEDTPRSTEYIDFLANTLVPEIDAALINISRLSSTISVILQPEELNTRDEVEVDYGDVLMFKYSLYAIQTITSIMKSYDLDVDVDEVFTPILNGYHFSINDELLAVYPDFLKLLTPNQLASAGNSLELSLNTYLQASDFIRAETDPQDDDLISFDPDSLEDEQEYRDLVSDLLASISEPTVIRNIESDTPLTLFLEPFFDAQINIRALLPEFDEDNNIVNCSFTDPTINGTVVGYSNDDWNALLGLFIPVQGAVSTVLPSTGTIHVESFGNYWNGYFNDPQDSTTISAPGPYTLQNETGSLAYIRAWSDEDNNGILSPGDLYGEPEQNPVEITSENCVHDNVDIVLETEMTGIKGRVSDSQGNPIPGIYVDAIIPEQDGSWCNYLNIWATTNQDGTFALNSIPAGMEIKIKIHALWQGFEDGYWTSSGPVSYCGDAQSFFAEGSKASDINITLQRASHISGSVMDTDGTPLVLASVYIYDAVSNEQLGGSTTDEYGNYNFYFHNAPSNQIKIQAQGPWDSDLMPVYYNNKPDIASADTIAAPPGTDINGIVFSLSQGGSISGYTTYSDGLPAANVCIDIYAVDTYYWVSRVYSDGSGYYKAGGLRPGEYIVMFTNYKINGEWQFSYYDNKTELNDADHIYLSNGTDITDINLSIPGFLCDLDHNGSFDSEDMEDFGTSFGFQKQSASDLDNDYDTDGIDLYRMILSISRMGQRVE